MRLQVTVQFCAEGQRWQRDFEIEADVTIRALKEPVKQTRGVKVTRGLPLVYHPAFHFL